LFFSLFKQNEFQEAIEYGERCYLRNPTNANLLVQLADCYYQTNQFSRSEYLIEKALDIEPENEKIKAFIKKLRNF
jgi:tetratricopeptide (TPR) repeat protein